MTWFWFCSVWSQWWVTIFLCSFDIMSDWGFDFIVLFHYYWGLFFIVQFRSPDFLCFWMWLLVFFVFFVCCLSCWWLGLGLLLSLQNGGTGSTTGGSGGGVGGAVGSSTGSGGGTGGAPGTKGMPVAPRRRSTGSATKKPKVNWAMIWLIVSLGVWLIGWIVS